MKNIKKSMSLILLFSGVNVFQCTAMEVHEIQRDGTDIKVINAQPDVIFTLATRFYKGTIDTPQDYEQALKLFKAVAMQEEDLQLRAKAIFNLGTMYANGEGLKKNPEAAVTCFFIVAQQNDSKKVKIAAQKLLSQRAPKKTMQFTPKQQAEHLLYFAEAYYEGESVEKDKFLCELCIRAAVLQNVNPKMKKAAQELLDQIGNAHQFTRL